jgi:hypothetical protein
MGFEKLFEYLVSIKEWFHFIAIVDEYEKAIVLQMGKYRRTLGPGWWFHCPFGIDDIATESVVPQTLNLSTQTLTSADKREVVLSGIIKYTMHDIKKAVLGVDDAEEMLGDDALGVISEYVEEANWSEVCTPEFSRRCFKRIRKEAFRYGLKVSSFRFSNKSTSRTFRLIND